jgi:TP901 family phage tail tape measure protein
MTLDDAKLRGSLQNTQRSLRSFGSSLTSIGTKVSAVGAAITAPFALATKQFISIGDQLDKMSRRTGVSVEALSKLGYAAELSGGSLEAVERLMKGLARSLYQAGQDSKESVEALEAVGTSFAELAELDAEQRLIRLADGLSNIEDPTRRAGLAMKVFGKAGTELLPMFEGGAAGMAALTGEAAQFNRVWSTVDASRAAELTDALSRLKSAIVGLSIQAASSFADQLIEITNNLAKMTATAGRWIRQNSQFIPAVVAAGAALTGLGAALATTGAAVVVLSNAIGVVASMASPGGILLIGIAATVVAFTDWRKEVELVSDALTSLPEALSSGRMDLAMQLAAKTFKTAWMQSIQDVRRGITDLYDTMFGSIPMIDPVGDFLQWNAEIGQKEIDREMQELEALRVQIKAAKRDFDAEQDRKRVAAEEKPVGEVVVPQTSRALQAVFSAMDWIENKWHAIEKASEPYVDALEEIKSIWEDTRTPLEKYEATVKRLNELKDMGLDPDTYVRAIRKAQEDLLSAQVQDIPQTMGREAILGGARAGQVFTAEAMERRRDEIDRKQLTALEKIEKNTRGKALAFN